MHELTGDFYTVGEILRHTLKGIGLSLGISTNMADVTARYVDVRLDRKKTEKPITTLCFLVKRKGLQLKERQNSHTVKDSVHLATAFAVVTY